jgi:hypothetical protein
LRVPIHKIRLAQDIRILTAGSATEGGCYEGTTDTERVRLIQCYPDKNGTLKATMDTIDQRAGASGLLYFVEELKA